VRLIPYAELPHAARDESVFAKVVSQAFSQRRKTLRNALKGVADTALLSRLGIDPGARAQELAVADFVRLADAVAGPG
jgi:16S rRNA (adenine1518-N6/adenine1519-N6)-dimethyltransferase